MGTERERRIEELLNKIKVERRTTLLALSEYFNVSTATIRRDLKRLQEVENVVQTLGGGVAYHGGITRDSTVDTMDVNVTEKIRIAEFLIDLINDFDDVLLGPGSTTLLVGRILSGITDRRFRIITNSLELALETMDLPNIETVLLGGVLRKKHSIGYPEHTDYLDNCNRTHKLIISADGLDAEHGATIFESSYVPILRRMITASKEIVLAVDSSKIGRVSFTTLLKPEQLEMVVTDYGASERMVKPLQEKGVEVHRV
jgi:DeoR/GlpR family transcriptional regulator of sugar metabolism